MNEQEVAGLKNGMEIRIEQAQRFIDQDINTEYWEGVKGTCEEVLEYLEGCISLQRHRTFRTMNQLFVDGITE